MRNLKFKARERRAVLWPSAALAMVLGGCGGSSGGPEVPTPTTAQGQVAFVSTRDGNAEIYVMNGDGSGQRRLTNNAGVDTQPSISSDGSKIVYVSERSGSLGLYVLSLDVTGRGVGQPKLIQNLKSTFRIPSFFPSASFSRDGQEIVYADTAGRAQQAEIYVINADGSGRRQLTNNQSTERSPVFSPDGSKVAFESLRLGASEFGIHLMNADGSGQRRLSGNTDHDTGPSFSPDGQLVVFTSSRDSGLSDSDAGEIYTMKLDGSGQKRLTSTRNTSGSASFSRVSGRIFFSSDGIFSMNARDGDLRRLTNNAAANGAPSAQ